MMKETGIPDLRKIAPFSGLPEHARRYLQARLRSYDFAAGQPIIQRGKRGQFMAVVGRGQVKLEDAHGNVHILARGQVFGEGMLRFLVQSSFSASARTETTLWVVKRTDWLVARELPPLPGEAFVSRRPRRVWLWPLVAILTLVLTLMILYPELLQFTNHRLTTMALEAGRPDLAENYLEFALSWQTNSAQLYDALGYSYYLQGKQTEALAAFEQAVSLDESYASAQNNLGVALLSQGKIGQAIEPLEAAVSLDPGNADAHHNLGNAYLATQEHEFAANAYQRAFELDPNQIEAKALWAGIALEGSQTDLARDAWEQIVDEKPDHSLANRGLGVIAVLEGRPTQALRHLEIARSCNPQDGITSFYLGLALDALGRPAEAANEFENALVFSDDPDLVHLARERLLVTRP